MLTVEGGGWLLALLLAVLQNNILFISFPRRLPTCFGGRSFVVLSPEIIYSTNFVSVSKLTVNKKIFGF